MHYVFNQPEYKSQGLFKTGSLKLSNNLIKADSYSLRRPLHYHRNTQQRASWINNDTSLPLPALRFAFVQRIPSSQC